MQFKTKSQYNVADKKYYPNILLRTRTLWNNAGAVYWLTVHVYPYRHSVRTILNRKQVGLYTPIYSTSDLTLYGYHT